MQASIGDRALNFTPTEFQLLAIMARQPGRIFTRGQLLEAVRGVAVESYERAIDSHIKNIRRKIEPDPRHPRYIQAVHGIGYRFTEE
jgi:two-component system OmpR family response regulator